MLRNSPKRVSIIIPAWKEARIIKKTLIRLSKINYPQDQLQIIVIATEEDGTYKAAKACQRFFYKNTLMVIPQGPGGKNVALQVGIEKSTGEIIVLFDADTLATKNWLKNLLSGSDKKNVVKGDFFSIKNTWITRYLMSQKKLIQKIQPTNIIGRSTPAFYKNLLEKNINYYISKDVRVLCDIYLGWQLAKKKIRVKLVEKARVFTKVPSNLKYYLIDQMRVNRAMLKYYSSRFLIKYVSVRIILLAIFLVFLIYLRSDLMLMGILVLLPLLAYLIRLILKFRRVSKITSDDINFVHFFILRFLEHICFWPSLLFLFKKEGIKHFKGER